MKIVEPLRYKLLTLLSVLSLLFVCLSAVAKYTTSTETSDTARVAEYNVYIDGFPTRTVSYDMLATTKISDIEYDVERGVYKPRSFLNGAYCSHLLSIHNDSEVDVVATIDYIFQNNDSRVYMAMFEGHIDNVLPLLCKHNKGVEYVTDLSSLADELVAMRPTELNLGARSEKEYTLVFWCEHDSVFPDEDDDGVADEDGKTLIELDDGQPHEVLTLDFTFVQER